MTPAAERRAETSVDVLAGVDPSVVLRASVAGMGAPIAGEPAPDIELGAHIAVPPDVDAAGPIDCPFVIVAPRELGVTAAIGGPTAAAFHLEIAADRRDG